MSVPAFGAAGTGAATTTGTLAIPYPSGITAGQLLVAQIFRFDTGDAAPTTPSGWTALADATGGTSSEHVFTKVAVGTESGNLSVTVGDGTDGFYGRMYRFTGDTSDWQFETGANGTGATASATMAAVTTTGADRLALNFLAAGNDVTMAPATGETGGDWLEPASEFPSTSGADAALGLQTAAMATAGTISGGTSTLGSATRWISISFAIYAQSGAGITGTLDANEAGADTATATASVSIGGAVASAEAGRDSFVAAGQVSVAGALAATEAGSDTLAATGQITAAGALAATEAGSDTFVAIGGAQPTATGTLAATETSADTASSTGSVALAGSLAATGSGTDSFAASGSVRVSGTVAAQEIGSDALAAAGNVAVSGSLSAAEGGPDTLVASGNVLVAGSIGASELGSDSFAATGTAGSPSGVTGALAATEGGTDAFAAAGAIPISGSISVIETGRDSLASIGSILVIGSLVASEAGRDSFAATGTATLAPPSPNVPEITLAGRVDSESTIAGRVEPAVRALDGTAGFITVLSGRISGASHAG